MTDLKSESLLERLEKNIKKYADKQAMAFIAPGPDAGKIQKKLTYQELDDEINGVRALLEQKGIKQGDKVVLVYPPCLEFTVAFLACLRSGITAVPVFPPNPLRKATLNMFAVVVQNCQANFALTSQEYNYMKKMAGIKETFTKFRRGNTDWPENLTWIVTDQTKSKSTSRLPLASIAPNDIAFLQYTSGSTSTPKGVMITHGNLAHNLDIITNELKAKDDTVVVSWLPAQHDMGLIGSTLGLLYCGGSGYYMSPLSFLQRPMFWIEAVSKYKATHLQAPNFAFKLTARKFSSGNLDLSSVRHVINAAEPVTEDALESFHKVFDKFGFKDVIYPTYGLAEHTVFVCSGGKQRLTVSKSKLEVDGIVELTNDNSKGETSRMIGCGFPANQKVDVKIVNTDKLEPVAEDVVGEIWVSSPSKAAGYLNMKDETKEDFHATLKGSSTEYLRTGDLGFLHGGELFICGRLKDLIIVGGRNYYPQDLEATAEASSDLVRPGCSAAFTVDPTNEGGEAVAIIMELKENPKDVEGTCAPLASSIRAAINEEHSLGITAIVFCQARTNPKTSSGKIARAWCRKAYNGKTLKAIYAKSFTTGTATSFEIEGGFAMEGGNGPSAPKSGVKGKSADEIRAMSKEEISDSLVLDISRVGSIPRDSIETKTPLITLLDSLSISQFKGMLEAHYAVKLSDEYLFRESTTVTKLVEVVKLGYAPDDGEGDGVGGAVSQTGQAKGLAGALGCPPGVVCTIL